MGRALLAMVWASAAACAPAGAGLAAGPDYHPTRDRIRAAPIVELDAPVRGSTRHPVPNIGVTCGGGGTAGRWSGVAYRFVAPETGSYRFAVRADFAALLELSLTQPGPQENRPIACAVASAAGVAQTLRAGELYAVTIDGTRQATGDFELVVTRDATPAARIQPEDPASTAALVAAAPTLDAGRVLGTFDARAAGPRAACGGLGSGTVYKLVLAAPATVALRAATQFPAALELRGPSGSALGCVRSPASTFELALPELALPAGSYVVVLDTTGLSPDLFDPLRGSPIHVATPGAGVHGAFALDATITPVRP